jgi:hypothetical protein
VQRAADGTPYAVSETELGFDVTLDIVDEKWFGLYHMQGLHRVHTYHVEMTDDRRYSITDDARTLEWLAGVPTLSASVERTRGRVWERSAEKIWAIDDQGTVFSRVVDYSFDSEEGRGLITAVAESLGWRQQRGTDETIGLVFAVIGGVGALVTVVLLGVLALLGRL